MANSLEPALLEEVLYDSEMYRIGKNYHASNIVFPVDTQGQKYIIKKRRNGIVDSLIQSYYTIQDSFFLGQRKFYNKRYRFLHEVEVLRKLGGFCAPKLIGYDENELILLREYLKGQPFSALRDSDKLPALEKGLEGISSIHNKQVVLDVHIKNLFYGEDKNSYWLDFEISSNYACDLAKALDLLRFVYSAYTVTRDSYLAISAAELVAAKYENAIVMSKVKELASNLKGGFGLWFSMRVKDSLNQEIKCKLMA